MATGGVTGIGGLFIRSRDPDALRAWYVAHLGIGSSEDFVWMQTAGPTVFMPFKADSDYFPADRQYMLNLRVEGIDDLIAELKAKGVAVITNPEWDQPGIGRFARIHDPEGNPIELWQPDEEE